MQNKNVFAILSVNLEAVINQIFLHVTKVSVTLEQKTKGAKIRKIIITFGMVAGVLMEDVISNALNALVIVAVKLHSVNSKAVTTQI